MKCQRYRSEKMEDVSAPVAADPADPLLLSLKFSPVKLEPSHFKPPCRPADECSARRSLASPGASHDKENSTCGFLNRTLEDSGYLTLHNSHIEDHREDGPCSAAQQTKVASRSSSPTTCGRRASALHAAATSIAEEAACAVLAASSSSSSSSSLPLLRFHEAVCEELAKDFKKNKRYDWTLVSKVAQDFPLQQVIGGSMGCEHVDVFSSLLLKDMKHILTKILALLEDTDLISCKKVSRTWKKIICNDRAALNRCHEAEQLLRDSSGSVKWQGSSMTRDLAKSRVVLSCIQSLASSTPNSKASKKTTPSQKNSQSTRFDQFVEAASHLKQHESLRRCRRCNSPATHHPEAQRATCRSSSCLYDFCTCCQQAFHGSSPCRLVQPRSGPTPIHTITNQLRPGSKRSVRRL